VASKYGFAEPNCRNVITEANPLNLSLMAPDPAVNRCALFADLSETQAYVSFHAIDYCTLTNKCIAIHNGLKGSNACIKAANEQEELTI